MRPPAPLAETLPTHLIAPPRGHAPLRLRELYDYRELLGFFVWRDVKVRYQQTVLGAAWAIIPPLATMTVFSLFFGRLGRIPSDGLPYPVFALAALVPWNYFAQAVTQSGNSLVDHERIISKIFFPRLIVPMAPVVSGLIDLLIGLVALACLLVFYRMTPTPSLAALPLFVGFAMLTALAAGVWLSALNVRYRDVRYVIPFLIQFWLFATPVAYSSTLVPDAWRPMYGLNPMVGVVDGFRWALLGTAAPSGRLLAVSAATVIVLLVGGIFYFRRVEGTLADVV